MEVWLYRSDASSTPRPLIVIGAAGSNLLHGMPLVDADRPEHLPYVRAGFLVAAYTIDGALSPEADDEAFTRAMEAFLEAEAGIQNASAAIDHATRELPVDPDRIYAAGHSSAATLALLAGAREPRIDAVAAFAPVVDLANHFRAQGFGDPTLEPLLTQLSPANYAAALARPRTLLFFAEDDDGTSTEDVRALHAQLPDDGRHELSTVPRGGHYRSMIDQGIPAAIRFFDATP